MSKSLFGPLFVPGALREAVGGRAWVRAMLDAEGALAVAEARAGLIPAAAARLYPVAAARVSLTQSS